MAFLTNDGMWDDQAGTRPAPFWTGRTQAVGHRVTLPPCSAKAASIAATSASCSGGNSRQRALCASMAPRALRRAWTAAAAGESGRGALLIGTDLTKTRSVD